MSIESVEDSTTGIVTAPQPVEHPKDISTGLSEDEMKENKVCDVISLGRLVMALFLQETSVTDQAASVTAWFNILLARSKSLVLMEKPVRSCFLLAVAC